MDTLQTQKVGNTRIGVEHINGEVKGGIWHLNVLIPCLQFGIISQVVQVGYLLQNFKMSIIQNRFPDENQHLDVGRPCQAEVRWYVATDDGLRDVRGNIRLWGLKSEIELHERMSAADEHNNKTAIEISELGFGRALGPEEAP